MAARSASWEKGTLCSRGSRGSRVPGYPGTGPGIQLISITSCKVQVSCTMHISGFIRRSVNWSYWMANP
eukprot:2486763-Rhodomonas_salina.1